MKFGRGEHELAKKQGVAFSKSVVKIKSRKIKNELLLLASLSEAKESATSCQVLEKKNSRAKEKRLNYGIVIPKITSTFC